MFRRYPRNTFYCFSPPVMLATFIIEIGLAAYTVLRYRLTPLTRLAVLLLGCLALFQLSEYFVCGGAGMNALEWSRIGYAAITALPAIGMHMLYVVAGRPGRQLVAAAYASAALFGAYFLFQDQAFSGHVCAGNYVIFQLTTQATWLYALYYYGWLFAAVSLGLRWYRSAKQAAQRRSIMGMVVGYGVFIVPTSIAVIINPEVMDGIPSVMCGFAVMLAVIVALYVLPIAGRADRRRAL